MKAEGIRRVISNCGRIVNTIAPLETHSKVDQHVQDSKDTKMRKYSFLFGINITQMEQMFGFHPEYGRRLT